MDESAARRAHAPSHVSVRAVLAAIGVMAAGIAAAIAAAAFVSARVPSPRDAPDNAKPPAIRGPVQRTVPASERESLMREKYQRLRTAGVDAATGKRHVPIDEAMRLLVDEGAAR
jgi:hypothetical protein